MAGLSFFVTISLVLSGVFAQQNDGPHFHPLPHNHRYSITINQNVLAGSPIFHAECVASDPVSNTTDYTVQEVIYGVSTTNTFITVNSTSGVIALTVDARDLPRASGESFTSILYCKYGRSTATVELVVHYEIQNEYVPNFTHGDQVLDLWVREDHIEREGPVIARLNATDDDLEPCNIVTFTIASGRNDGNFRIGSENGVLELNRNLNYDNHYRKYNLTIQATNTQCGDKQYSDQTTVCVYVVDVDDEHPTFEQHMYTFTFDELQQPNNFVQLRCLDPDTSGAHIVYEEDFTSEENPFVINHRTGNISATQPLDYEQQTSHHLTFTCYSVLNSGIRDTAVVRVLVNPVNEYLPEVRQNFAYIPFDYTSPVGTLLASASGNSSHALVNLVVTDRDRGHEHGKVQFKFAGSSEYYNYFNLDPESGDLTLIRQLDFDVCSDNRVDIPLRIIACDALKDESRLQFCPIVAIYVAITSPSCTLTFLQENYTVYVSESTKIGSELLEVGCEIPGRRRINNSTLLHQTIETFSPDVRFLHTLRIEGDRVILQEPLDYESVHQFTIYLRCSNAGGQESIASLLVHVLPENDNPPYFQRSLYTFKVTAKQVEILPTTIGHITAMDEDRGMPSNLTYSLTHNQDFDSMNDWSTYFTLNRSENGTVFIIMNSLPTQEIIVFDIIVSDGVHTAQSSILIDVPDGAKIATSSSLSTDQCGIFCITLLIILIVFMLMTIGTLAVVCICYASRRKQKITLSNMMELEESKSHTTQYSSLQRNNVQLQTNTVDGKLMGPTVAACPAYLQSGGSHGEDEDEDVEYHYVPSELQLSTPNTGSPALYQQPRVSTMEMEDYIKMQESTQPSGNGLEKTVHAVPAPLCTTLRCSSESDVNMMQGPSPALEQDHPLSFGVLRSNHSVENIYEHIQ